MNKRALIFLLAIIISFSFSSIAQNSFKEDIKLYQETMQNSHVNAFSYITRKDFNLEIERINSNIGRLSEEEILVELLMLNTKVNDEHTTIIPRTDELFPIHFKLFDDGLTVVKAAQKYNNLLMQNIIALEDKSLEEIKDLLAKIIKNDNKSYQKLYMEYYLNNPRILYGLGVLENQNEINITYLSSNKDTLTLKVDSEQKRAIEWKKSPYYKNMLAYSNNKNYWFHISDNNEYLYFNYLLCLNDDKERFKNFNKRMLKTIKNKSPNKIILDLRRNPGGNSTILTPFIKFIKKSSYNNENRFFVLTGIQTFSSALLNAIDLKKNTNATFIGQPTSGNLNHFGEVGSVDLGVLQARLTYSNKYFENWKGKKGPLIPEIELPVLIADFQENKDVCLEKAIGK